MSASLLPSVIAAQQLASENSSGRLELSLFPNAQGMLSNQLSFRTVEEVHQHCLTYTGEYINAVSSMRSLILIGVSVIALAAFYLLWLWYAHVPKQQPPSKPNEQSL